METKNTIRAWINWKSTQINDTYTQDMLARDAGIWSSDLSQYLAGKVEPRKKTLDKIARAFGITMSEFWAGPNLYGKKEPAANEYIIDGKTVSYYRKNRGISIDVFAKTIGISPKALTGAEENNFVINENSARRISDALNIKMEEIIIEHDNFTDLMNDFKFDSVDVDKSLEVICSICNHINKKNKKFCENCGQPLTASRRIILFTPYKPSVSQKKEADISETADANEISKADIIKTMIIKLLSGIDDDSILQEILSFLEFKITQKINK